MGSSPTRQLAILQEKAELDPISPDSSALGCPLLVSKYAAASSALPSVFLELPVPVIQWADLAGLEPSRDAVEVECVL